MLDYALLVLATLRAACRARSDLVLENLLLRHQLAGLTRPARPRRRVAFRLLDHLRWVLVRRVRRDWPRHLVVVTPGAVVRWHRTGWRWYWHHAHAIWAADLCVAQPLTCKPRYVLLFIAHGRRELAHLAVTAPPSAARVWRPPVEATPRGRRPTHLLRGRDSVSGGLHQAYRRAA